MNKNKLKMFHLIRCNVHPIDASSDKPCGEWCSKRDCTSCFVFDIRCDHLDRIHRIYEVEV